jgi:hypothetical protein
MKFKVKRGCDPRRPVALISNDGSVLYLQLDPSGLGPAAEGQHVILGGQYGKKHRVKRNGSLDITSVSGNTTSYTPVYEGDTVEITF